MISSPTGSPGLQRPAQIGAGLLVGGHGWAG